MDNHTSTSRAEAERLLGMAEKLLRSKDLAGSKDFAILAQEAEPLLEGSDQIVAVVEVLLASEKRVNNHSDWYSILQVGPRCSDAELIRKQYRRLALLLHPDKNKYPYADSAFHLVADAWAVLSDPVRKSVFDRELGLYFSRVDLEASRKQKEKEMQHMNQEQVNGSRQQTPAGFTVTVSPTAKRGRGRPKGSKGTKAKKSGGAAGAGAAVRSPNIWTACPYCYNMYEYPRMYEGCCLRCQNCKRAFTADGVEKMPPKVPGKEEYYCCWGVFPMGFTDAANQGRGKSGGVAKGFANWMPPMQSGGLAGDGGGGAGNANAKRNPKPKATPTPRPTPTPGNSSGPRKRGRPRKNPLP